MEESDVKPEGISLDEWMAQMREKKLRPTVPNAHKVEAPVRKKAAQHDNEFAQMRQSLRSVSISRGVSTGKLSASELPRRIVLRSVSDDRVRHAPKVHTRSVSEMPHNTSSPDVDEPFPLDAVTANQKETSEIEENVTPSSGVQTSSNDAIDLNVRDDAFPLDHEVTNIAQVTEQVTVSSAVNLSQSITLRTPMRDDFPLDHEVLRHFEDEQVTATSSITQEKDIRLSATPKEFPLNSAPREEVVEEPNILEPVPILLTLPKKHIVRSESRSRLWALGSNGHSQLSVDSTQDCSYPIECILPDALTSTDSKQWRVACGGNHTFILTSENELYGCGSNELHQLGLKDSFDVATFKHLHAFTKWKHVVAGFSFSILVSMDDHIYSAGACAKGSLGLTYRETETQGLSKLDFDLEGRTITSIHAGLAHVVMKLSDGSMYGWGSGRHRRLGKKILANTFTPTLLQPYSKGMVFDVACGKDWTSVLTSTTVETTNDGKKKPKIPASVPIDDTASPVIQLTSNWSTLHLLRGDGKITSYGRGDRAQYAPKGLPFIRTLASGSEHSVGLSIDGKVYAWGWNEHGNCGTEGATVDQVCALEVEQGYEAKGVAAGYGTTFIW